MAKRRSKNPPDGLKLSQARPFLAEAVAAWAHGTDKQYLPRLIAATRPADRDKLKAEAEHLYRMTTPQKSNPIRRNNPGLAIIHAGTIVNPPKKRKNRSLGHQTGGVVDEILLADYIEQYGMNDELEKAIKAYKRFHQSDPISIKVIQYDDNSKEDTEKYVMVVGQAPETHYVLPKDQLSNKNGSHWVHHHKSKKLPYLVMDPTTGILMTVGGAYRTTTWLYD